MYLQTRVSEGLEAARQYARESDHKKNRNGEEKKKGQSIKAKWKTKEARD